MSETPSTDAKRDWIEHLQLGLREGYGDLGELNELRTVLLEDQEARLIYLEINQLDSMLETTGLAKASQPARRAMLPKLPLDWIISGLIGSGIAAGVILLLGKLGSPDQHPDGNPEAEMTPVASLISELDAVIGGKEATNDHAFGEESVSLDHGIAQLAFRNGAQIVFEGKCGFQIVDAKTVVLNSGKLWAHCPIEARGFKVLTPEGRRITDLGTDFGIEVTPAGETSVHVFDGLVDVADRHADTRTIRAGEALRWSAGGTAPKTIDADLHKFVTANSLAQKRLAAYHSRMRARTDLLLYFDFADTLDGHTQSRTTLAETPTQGKILGATPVSGRIEGKRALLFENPGDAISFQFDQPTATRKLTIALWVKIDRLDTILSTLLNSTGWEPGDMHFQVTGDGSLRAGICGGASFESPSGSVRPGQWQLLAVTWDLDSLTARFFADGIPLRSTPTPRSGPPRFPMTPRFGACQIGQWSDQPQANKWEDRSLKGRIDELMIFNDALSDLEIAKLHGDGKP